MDKGIMSDKFDKFAKALFELCKEHRVNLSISIDDSIIVEDIDDGAEIKLSDFRYLLTDHTGLTKKL